MYDHFTGLKLIVTYLKLCDMWLKYKLFNVTQIKGKFMYINNTVSLSVIGQFSR